MNQTIYAFALALVAVAVIVNRGNRSRAHQAVQLYLTILVLFGALVAYGRL